MLKRNNESHQKLITLLQVVLELIKKMFNILFKSLIKQEILQDKNTTTLLI